MDKKYFITIVITVLFTSLILFGSYIVFGKDKEKNIEKPVGVSCEDPNGLNEAWLREYVEPLVLLIMPKEYMSNNATDEEIFSVCTSVAVYNTGKLDFSFPRMNEDKYVIGESNVAKCAKKYFDKDNFKYIKDKDLPYYSNEQALEDDYAYGESGYIWDTSLLNMGGQDDVGEYNIILKDIKYEGAIVTFKTVIDYVESEDDSTYDIKLICTDGSCIVNQVVEED
jgi:hypothetical protein